MTKPVHLDPEAHFEIAESVDWYEEREEGLGLRFLRDVDALLDAIPDVRRRPDPDLRDLNVFSCEVGSPWPYRLVAQELDAQLVVLALVHHRREPGYWHRRVRRQPTP